MLAKYRAFHMTHEKKLSELAEAVGGKVVGDPDVEIGSAATLEGARAGQISFLANRKYASLLATTEASAVVVGAEIETRASQLIAADPYFAFREIVVLLHGHRRHPVHGVSERAYIAPSAVVGEGSSVGHNVTILENVRIGQNCVIYPGAFIGPDTEIGDDCLIYPNVVIYNDTRIGHRVIIQANATIGEDGFGFSTHKGEHHKIPHIGRVVLEDDVEIGSGCGIERGTLDETVIGKGAKIGDLVAIGHGTKIGPGCLLVAQVGVAGSSKLGHHCMVGGQAGIAGHIEIGNMVGIAAKSGVNHGIPDGQFVLGTPAFEIKKAREAYLLIKSLPDMRKDLRKLKRRAEVEDAEGK